MLTSLPLVWFDQWSLTLHALLIFAVTAIPNALLIHRLWNRSTTFQLPEWNRNFIFVLTIAAAAIWVQRHGIYNVYATHDPAAYIGSALNLSRTGSFFHHNEMSALAKSGKAPHLEALLNRNNPPLVPDKMGVIPLGNSAKEAYHGVFGASLFYALGIEYFGEADFIKVHWIHLLAAVILLFTLLQILVGPGSSWSVAGVLLFVACPLIPGVFRETLSEPLAVVFFLGILLALLRVSEASSWKYVLLSCVLASICVRISGALYVAPFLLTMLLLQRSNKTDYRFLFATALGLAAVLFTISFAGAYYVRAIVLGHLRMVVPSVETEAFPLEYVGLAMSLCGALAVLTLQALRKPIVYIVDTLRTEGPWKKLWIAYFAILFLGLAFRYGKLFTKLSQYYGGFPFVSYHLEGMLFYFGPIVALVGLYYWFKRCYQAPTGALTFLQTFLPFAIFFYLVIRFLPLDVQMNFLRYQIIELLPLAVLGTIAIFAHAKRRHLVRVAYVASLAWGTTLTAVTNHPDICSGSLGYYSELLHAIKLVKQPVIVVVKPTWRELTFLTPLHYGFGVPVVIANHAFSHKESKAIDELQAQGYEPILAVGKGLTALGTPVESDREWRNWLSIDHCYRYSGLRLMAPPLELDNTCFEISLLRAIPSTIKKAAMVERSWAYQNSTVEIPLQHWFGVTVDGKKFCEKKSKALDFGLVFDPEKSFALPILEINGVTSEGAEIVSTQSGKSKSGHRVLVRVPATKLSCKDKNIVDIYFLPYAGSAAVRPVRLVPADSLGAKSETLAEAQWR